MLWQVPTLSLTAQAFLFTIALAPDSSRTARVVASGLSIIMTVLSMHLMARHRQAEHTDAHWIADYEREHFGRSWHGKDWAVKRNALPVPFFAKLKGYPVWMAGLGLFGLAAVAVLLLTFLSPGILS